MMTTAKKKSHAPTIRDVARLAGVSPASAARALHNYGYASPELREAATSAARRLGYEPNRNAQSIKTGRTQVLGFVGADISNPFFASALRGATDVVGPLGYQTLIANTDEDVDTEISAVQSLVGQRVDGMIVSPADVSDIDHLVETSENGMPIVLLDREPPGLDVDRVVIDNVAAAQSTVTLLLEAGHRVGIVAELRGALDETLPTLAHDAEVDVRALTSSGARVYGYLAAHWQLDVPVDDRLIARAGGYSASSARSAAGKLLDLPTGARPSALFSVDNVMSLGAYEAVLERNIAIPRDLSFIAFDDDQWMRLVRPAISAVAQPAYEMGRLAANLLQRRIETASADRMREVVPVTFLERGSVEAPASFGVRASHG